MRTLTPDTIDALKGWAKHHAAMFVEDKTDGELVDRSRFTDGHKGGKVPVTLHRFSRDWVMLQLHNMTYKDEFEFVVEEMKQHLGKAALADFEARVSQFPPRSDEAFARVLEEMRPAGYAPKES